MHEIPRARKFLIPALAYSIVIAATLAVFEVACNLFGILPPAFNPGDPQLGWRPADGTGRFEQGKCTEFSSRETVTYRRNEEGVRSDVSLSDTTGNDGSIRIAVVGDSHTELCAPNEALHSGQLTRRLEDDGVKATPLTYGVGRYSPLQAYLAYREVLRKYHPSVVILNLYTGNDFYDMLRIDDRPHFAGDTALGYRVVPPVWFTYDDPGSPPRSRILSLARAVGDRTGVRTALQRLSYLRSIGAANGGGVWEVTAYLRSLVDAREPSVGYPDAFTAQMLNQQLFFRFFPKAKRESLNRVQALLAMARRENPGVTFVLSPLPSYQLVGESPVDEALTKTTQRLPVSMSEGIALEQELYDALSRIAAAEGWLFVDNLSALRTYTGRERLFNDFDYHLLPVASSIVGQAQHDVLLPRLLPSPAPTRSRDQVRTPQG